MLLFGRKPLLYYVQCGEPIILGGWLGNSDCLGYAIGTFVLGQPFVVDAFIITILAQVSTFAVLVKVLHNLFQSIPSFPFSIMF